jgi:hypothetical protein
MRSGAPSMHVSAMAERGSLDSGTAAGPADPLPADPARTTAPEPVRVEPGEGGRKKKKKNGKKNRLGSARGVETLFRTSYRTHVDMSALADAKANIMITINGLMVSILLASISPKIDASPWLLLPSAILLSGCVVSMVYAVLAARPRYQTRAVTLEAVRSDAANILFFGNFVSLPEEDYVQGMSELIRDGERLYANMLRDIYSLGGVLERKFRLLRVSYTVFMFGLVISAILFLVVFAAMALSGTPPRPLGTSPAF